MSKYRLDAPTNTSLDPMAFEKKFLAPDNPNPSKFSGVVEQLEFSTPLNIEQGYGTMGNAGYAMEVINEAKAYNQGAGELLAKGLGNVVKTIGIEVAKTPGYAAGIVGAIGNELIGDGKESMRMIVDNAWVNTFESLDQSIKDAMPIHMSKLAREGGLTDKLSSGAWWAESGADGLGFMLAMFAPGAALKAAGIGSKIAAGAEGLANLSNKLGKVATGESWVAKLGLMTAPEGRVAAAVEAKTAELLAKGGGVLDDVAKAEIAAVEKATRKAAGSTYKYTQGLARNANGFSSAIINTTLESSAEAANTFDNLKKNYLGEGLTEEEANLKAGEGAAAVFKGNMALLAVSNILDEAWIWKSISSAGEKEAAKSLMSKIFKDGVVDTDVLKNLPKEFTRAKTLKRIGTNFGKGILKEGVYEEGSQTTLQQNIEKGIKGENILDDLYNVGASYFDDFANNTELQESIFLGGLLGGGASIIGTIQENQALKGALHGSEARTKDNSIFAKYGLLPETKAQKGLGKILQENHIKQFRSYKDLLETTPEGKLKLNDQKLVDANLEQSDVFRANILYDLSLAQGNKLGQEIFGQFLAANYVQGFIGQEGGKELFQTHVKDQVLPAWQKRFQETFDREATDKESQEYLNQFKSSGERVFDAHKIAEETNYPQRYYHEKTKEYQDFRESYFHKKFQNLVALDSFKARRQDIMKEVSEAGLTMLDLEDTSQVTDPVKLQKILDIKDDLKELNESEAQLSEEYNDFYTKEGVKKMFEDFKTKKAQYQETKTKAEELNKDLKEKVDSIPERNAAELARLETIHAAQGGEDHLSFKDKNGKRYTIDQLENEKTDITDLGLTFDDIEKSEWDEFGKTQTVSDGTIKKIVDKIKNGQDLSDREETIRDSDAYFDKINQILKAENLKEEAAVEAKTGEVPNTSVEDTEYDIVDQTIEDVYTKLGVNMFPSTGLNVDQKKTTLIDGLYVESMTPSASQKLWFETLENEVKKNPQGYTVKVVRNDDKSNPELHAQIQRNTATDALDGDLTTVLYKDGKPVIKDGNYVFTGLGRPDKMYDVGETKLYSRIAKSAILDNFFVSLGMVNVKIDKLTKAQKDKLEVYGIKEPTKANIERQAYLHAKKEYKDWYESLQNSSGQHLQVAGITKGHAVKMYEDEGKTKRAWRSPLKGIPGLKLDGNKLVGGKFAMSVLGFIDVAGERFTIPSGDVVVVDDDKNVHPMRPRNLNESEVQTVLHLLSLRDSKGPTEAIMVEAPENIIFGTSGSVKAPVFYNDGKGDSRKTVISSLISFGSKPDGKNKTGGKGEIYFPKDSLSKIPEVVWTDFEGKTHKIEVRLITEALQTNDFTKIQDLISFLQQKRFNVNEALLGTSLTSPKFSKPMTSFKVDEAGKRVPTLEWDQSRSYFDHMLNDVLTTTTQKLDGYPNRVQRNLWFNKNPIPAPEVIDEKGNVQQPRSNAGVVVVDDVTDTLRGKPSTVGTVTQSTTTKTILWDSFGNESNETWNVGKDTKTRGGQPAVELYRTKVEDSITGKTYSKEYADKNGIKYGNTSTELHIVPTSELPQLETIQEKPTEIYNSAEVAFFNSSEGTVFRLTTTNPSTKGHHSGTKGNTFTSSSNVVRIGNYFIEQEDIGKPIDKVRQYDPRELDKKNKELTLAKIETPKEVLENTEVKPSRRRARKSLDEFKDDMDKILTTTDLFKMKIKSGEIIQNCK